MIHLFSFISLFKSSDNTETEMIIDDVVNSSDVSELNLNYTPFVCKLKFKNANSEIENYKKICNEDERDIKYKLNTLVADFIINDISKSPIVKSNIQRKKDEEKSFNPEKNCSIGQNIHAQAENKNNQDKEDELYLTFVTFKHLFINYYNEKSNFKLIIKNANMILRHSIELAKQNKPVKASKADFDSIIKWIEILNDAYCAGFNKIKDYVNNIPDDTRRILTIYVNPQYELSLYNLIKEFNELKKDWNSIVEGKNQ